MNIVKSFIPFACAAAVIAGAVYAGPHIAPASASVCQTTLGYPSVYNGTITAYAVNNCSPAQYPNRATVTLYRSGVQIATQTVYAVSPSGQAFAQVSVTCFHGTSTYSYSATAVGSPGQTLSSGSVSLTCTGP